MEQLYDLILTNNLPALKSELDRGWSSNTVVHLIEAALVQTRSPELYDLLLSYHHHHNADTSLFTMALSYRCVPGIRAMLRNQHFRPIGIINPYILMCPFECFQDMLASPKFTVNRNTLLTVARSDHPDKIACYLRSTKFSTLTSGLPTSSEVKEACDSICRYETSLYPILNDDRINLSEIPVKQLRDWLQFPTLVPVLQRRLPKVVEPLVQKKDQQDATRQQHLDKKWSLFG